MKNSITEKNKTDLLAIVKTALNRKKLQRIKDVVYNKDTGIIKSIPAFDYDKETGILSLKNSDKKQSTLKSLAPKKTDGKKVKKQKTQKKSSPKHNISMKIRNSPRGKNVKISDQKEKRTQNIKYLPK